MGNGSSIKKKGNNKPSKEVERWDLSLKELQNVTKHGKIATDQLVKTQSIDLYKCIKQKIYDNAVKGKTGTWYDYKFSTRCGFDSELTVQNAIQMLQKDGFKIKNKINHRHRYSTTTISWEYTDESTDTESTDTENTESE